MSAALQGGALLCTLLGLLSAGVVLLASRAGVLALRVLLEFLLAAGLLRLADDPGWREIAVAAVVVALRRLVSAGLGRSPVAS